MKQQTTAVIAAAITAYIEQDTGPQSGTPAITPFHGGHGRPIDSRDTAKLAAIMAAVTAYSQTDEYKAFAPVDVSILTPSSPTSASTVVPGAQSGTWRTLGRIEALGARLNWRSKIRKTH